MVPGTNPNESVEAASPMLPADPALRGRLFCAARALLGWTQAGLACAAGVGTAVVYRVEAGCPGAGTKAVAALAAAIEAAGVHFIGNGDIWGHGLRYVGCPRPSGPPGGGARTGRLTVAAGHVARQRALVARLEATGASAQAELARGLLAEMERALAAMERSRELIVGPSGDGWPRERAAPAFAVAA